MAETVPLAPPNARAQVLVGVLLGAVGLATLLTGRVAISAYIALVAVAAYVDLRRLLAPWGHIVTVVLGGAGVGGFLWAGYSGRLQLIASTGAGLVLALLATRVFLHEFGARSEGTTSDIAATLGAASVAGVFGAHVLLIRSIPRVGFRGLLTFGLMVLCNEAVAFFVERWRSKAGRTALGAGRKSWPATAAGFVTSVAIGVAVGVVLDPPFGIGSGVAFGAAMGIITPLGDLVFGVIERSAGAKRSGSYLGPLGGALDAAGSLLFAAPAFYWALRTLAL